MIFASDVMPKACVYACMHIPRVTREKLTGPNLENKFSRVRRRSYAIPHSLSSIASVDIIDFIDSTPFCSAAYVKVHGEHGGHETDKHTI